MAQGKHSNSKRKGQGARIQPKLNQNSAEQTLSPIAPHPGFRAPGHKMSKGQPHPCPLAVAPHRASFWGWLHSQPAAFLDKHSVSHLCLIESSDIKSGKATQPVLVLCRHLVLEHGVIMKKVPLPEFHHAVRRHRLQGESTWMYSQVGEPPQRLQTTARVHYQACKCRWFKMTLALRCEVISSI